MIGQNLKNVIYSQNKLFSLLQKEIKVLGNFQLKDAISELTVSVEWNQLFQL